MLRKTMSLLIVFMMIFTIAIPTNAYATSVNDYAGHWAEETVQLWLNEGRITGYPDGSFKPDGKVTRAEFITMVNKLFNFTETSDISFDDVNSNDWYYKEVQKAFKAGYITGVSETKFSPNSNLTREQAAVIVAKAMNLEGNVDAAGIFTDYSKISSWALDLVGAAASAEIVKGYTEDNTFRPQNSITRAEAVVTLNRTIDSEDLIVNEAGTIIENKIVRNIHITKEVGSGDVTLKNVTVTGELLVEGGGLNTVTIEDSNINKLTSNKADGKVRILLKGGSEIDLTSILSGATLEQQDLTGDGFADVVIEENANTSQTITIKADIKEFSFKATIKVNVITGIIESIIIDEAAEDLVIDLGKDVKVLSVVVNTKVSFTGNGTIEKAEVNADGVTFEKKPTETTVAPGVKAPEVTTPPAGGGGPSSGPGPVEDNIAVTGVSISLPTTLTSIYVGDTIKLTANIEPENATNKAVSWSSSNTTVAAIAINDLEVTVTGKTVGESSITVTTVDGGFTETVNVIVSPAPIEPVEVSAITVTPTTMKLTVGGTTGTITETVVPSNATNKNVTWSSDNTGVATVDNGVVTAHAEGTAIITVTTQDGNKTANCEVKVISFFEDFSKGNNDVFAPNGNAEVEDNADGTISVKPTNDSTNGAFTKFGAYSNQWPTGGYITKVKVYINPEEMEIGEGFTWSSAINNAAGSYLGEQLTHIRKNTDGKVLIGNKSGVLNIQEDQYTIDEITVAGYYTIQTRYYEETGIVKVELKVIDENNEAKHTSLPVVLKNTENVLSDITIAGAGGNRYGWFTYVNMGEDGLKVDEVSLEKNTSDASPGPDYAFHSSFDGGNLGVFAPNGNAEVEDNTDGTISVKPTNDSTNGAFTKFGAYSNQWPTGGYITKVKVYINPEEMEVGEGFTWSSAINNAAGSYLGEQLTHIRKNTDGKVLIGNKSGVLNIQEDQYTIDEITVAGYYTIQTRYYEETGIVKVELKVMDENNSTIHTSLPVVLKNTENVLSDITIAGAGGNRYGWFTYVNMGEGGLKVDEVSLEKNASDASPGPNYAFHSSFSGGNLGVFSPNGDAQVVDNADGTISVKPTNDSTNGAFTKFGAYSNQWPTGGYITKVKVYIDPQEMVVGQGFTWSSAINDKNSLYLGEQLTHIRKLANETVKIGNKSGVSNTQEDQYTDVAITEAGYYTIQTRYYEEAGIVQVELIVIDENNLAIHTSLPVVLKNSAENVLSDITVTEAGGNRYGWFTYVNMGEGGLKVDEVSLEK